MKKILILCLITVLIPGIMAGCSKNEQPVREQPSQQQPSVTVAKSLQDVVALASEQAQKTLEKARSRVGDVSGTVHTNPAEVTPGMLDSFQGVRASAETLKKNSEASGQSADTGLTETAKGVASIPGTVTEAPAVTSTDAVSEKA